LYFLHKENKRCFGVLSVDLQKAVLKKEMPDVCRAFYNGERTKKGLF